MTHLKEYVTMSILEINQLEELSELMRAPRYINAYDCLSQDYWIASYSDGGALNTVKTASFSWELQE